MPDYLYHYTDLNTLALILKHKKLRFNCLNRVDDLNEGIARDLDEIGQYFFVSCWTDKEEESIPFWSMYTNDMKGVRIKLPRFPFELHNVDEIEIDGLENNLEESIHSPIVLQYEDYVPLPFKNEELLQEVNYTDDEDLLFPKIRYVDLEESNLQVKLNLIGKHKRKEWRFQSEWRYIIKAYPLGLKEIEKYGLNFGSAILSSLLSGKRISIDEYYLDLDKEKIKDMEIVLGPKTDEGDEIIVKSLVNKFNSEAKIRMSSLRGEIR